MNKAIKLSLMASACAFFVLMPVSEAHAEEILTASESYLSGSGNDILLTDNNMGYSGGILTGDSLGSTGDLLVCDHSASQGDLLYSPADVLRNDTSAYGSDIFHGPVLTEAGSGYSNGTDILCAGPGFASASYQAGQSSDLYATGLISSGGSYTNSGTAQETTFIPSSSSGGGSNTSANVSTPASNVNAINDNNSASAAERVLNAINARRRQEGCRELKLNSDLNRVASARISEITKKFSHIRPNGKNSVSILSEYGIDYNMAGENIARSVSTPERVVAGWASSPTHNRCMMNNGYAQAGIGTATVNGCTYWVLILTD